MVKKILPILWLFALVSSTLSAQTPQGDSLSLQDSLSPSPAPVDTNQVPTFEEEGSFRFGLSSPYQTVWSHIHFLSKSTYHPDSAALTLYTPEPGGEEAIRLAIQLKQFFQGEGYFIRADELPRDPNYFDSAAGKQVFYPVPEETDVFLVKKGKFWVYSHHTVQKIPTLHSRVFPFGTLDWIPEWARKKVFKLETWQWIGLMIYAAAAWLVHRVLSYLFGVTLERSARKFMKKTITWSFFTKVSRPGSLLVILLIARILVPALQLPIQLNQYLMAGIRIGIPIMVVLIFYHLVGLFTAYWAAMAAGTKNTLDDQLVPLIRRMLKIIVILVGAVFVLQAMGVDITTLLAGLSIGGLALALAAQDTVKNFLASVMIFIDKPFQVGEFIVSKDIEGVVEEVGMRSTRVRTPLDSLIYVPNTLLADAAVNNLGMRKMRRMRVTLRVPFDVSMETLQVYVEGIREILRLQPKVKKDQIEVFFNEVGENGFEILWNCYFMVPDFQSEMGIRQEVLTQAVQLGQTLGIRFAHPARMLHIEQGAKESTPDLTQHREARDRFLASLQIHPEKTQLARNPEENSGD